MEITIATRNESGRAVVDVSGEVDVHTAPELDAALSDVVENGTYDVVVDLSKVDFLDSTGLGVLVKTLKRVREHSGSLAVVAASDRIAKVFRITGLDAAITIHDDITQALA